MSNVVYTAIFGGYDELQQPVAQDRECEFLCFTDNNQLSGRVGAWQVIQVPAEKALHPRMQAKKFKLLSHEIFPGGRLPVNDLGSPIDSRLTTSVWIDGRVKIKSPSFVRDMQSKLHDAKWALFVHPHRNCIYDEAAASLKMNKYKGLPIFAQVDAYASIVPRQSGLHACTVIVRREPLIDQLVLLNESWWAENQKWTYQDQISLPYVLRKLDAPQPAKITENLYDNRWFDFAPHNSDA